MWLAIQFNFSWFTCQIVRKISTPPQKNSCYTVFSCLVGNLSWCCWHYNVPEMICMYLIRYTCLCIYVCTLESCCCIWHALILITDTGIVDYVANSTYTFTFPAGREFSTPLSVTIPIVNDAVVEPEQFFRLDITSPNNTVISLATTGLTLRITDDDG